VSKIPKMATCRFSTTGSAHRLAVPHQIGRGARKVGLQVDDAVKVRLNFLQVPVVLGMVPQLADE